MILIHVCSHMFLLSLPADLSTDLLRETKAEVQRGRKGYSLGELLFSCNSTIVCMQKNKSETKTKVESLLLLAMDDFTFHVIRRIDYKYYTFYHLFWEILSLICTLQEYLESIHNLYEDWLIHQKSFEVPAPVLVSFCQYLLVKNCINW